MPDQIIDDTALDGNWYDGLVEGDAALPDEHHEALKGFESQTDFATKYFEMANANWRDPFVTEGDDKSRKAMERFANPSDYGNAFNEAQQKIRSGKLKDDIPGAEADDESIKQYRENNGIPLESADYLQNLPDGLVIGEDDAPIAGIFMEALHSVHAEPRVSHALLTKYNEFSEEAQAAQNELDTEQAKAATDSLRESWQADYRANINLVGAFLEGTFGAELKDQILNGRFADGRAFMNDPKILEGLAAAQRRLDPVTQIVAPGHDAAQTLNDEIAEIEKFMAEHRTAYNKDESKQARLRQLYDLRIKQEAA